MIACIGCGGMGYGDALEHVRFGEIAMYCDVDTRHAGRMTHDPRV